MQTEEKQEEVELIPAPRKPPEKLDPARRAEIAKDAIIHGPKFASEKHNVSLSTASKLKNGESLPGDLEERTEFAMRLYEGLRDVHDSAKVVAVKCMELLMQDGAKYLDRVAKESPAELTRMAHDAARILDVTIPKTNLIDPKKGGDAVAAIYVQEAIEAPEDKYKVVNVVRDKEGDVIDV